MKITKHDYNFLKLAIEKVETHQPEGCKQHKAKVSGKRYRWDILRATGLNVFGDGVGVHGT